MVGFVLKPFFFSQNMDSSARLKQEKDMKLHKPERKVIYNITLILHLHVNLLGHRLQGHVSDLIKI